MKKKWLIVSMILAVMALGMIMAACSSGTEAPGVEEYRYTVGNVLYILEMTENRGARYTAVTNDLYKLFAVYGGKDTPVLVSEGYIANVATGATAKVQNYSLKDANGTNLIVQVVYATVTNASGKTSEVPIVAQVVGLLVAIPGSGGQTVQLTSGTPVTADLPAGSTVTSKPSTLTLTSPVTTTPSNPGATTYNPGTTTPSSNPGATGSGGSLTITGIPSKFNGKYIGVEAQESNLNLMLWGAQSINMATGVVTLVPISGGRAVVPMWKAIITNGDLQSFAGYTGNDTIAYYENNDNYGYLATYIISTPTMSYGTGSQQATTLDMKVFQTVTFKNGNGTVNYATGFVPDYSGGGWETQMPDPNPGSLTLTDTLTLQYTHREKFIEKVNGNDIVVMNFLLKDATYTDIKTTLTALLGPDITAQPGGGGSEYADKGSLQATQWPLNEVENFLVFEINVDPSSITNEFHKVEYRLVDKTGAVYKGTSWQVTRNLDNLAGTWWDHPSGWGWKYVFNADGANTFSSINNEGEKNITTNKGTYAVGAGKITYTFTHYYIFEADEDDEYPLSDYAPDKQPGLYSKTEYIAILAAYLEDVESMEEVEAAAAAEEYVEKNWATLVVDYVLVGKTLFITNPGENGSTEIYTKH